MKKTTRIILLSLATALASLPSAMHAQEGGGARADTARVRRELEAAYARNVDAFVRQDVEAVMALRAEGFHTVTPDGRVNSREEMRAYTQRLVDQVERFVSLTFDIEALRVRGDTAEAVVRQWSTRMQRRSDGAVHEVRAGAVQRETWVRTPDGWKLWRVDDIHDLGVWVDGRPRERSRE